MTTSAAILAERPPEMLGERSTPLSGIRWTSLAIATLAGVAAGFGLFAEGVYKNNSFARAAFRGSDLVTLTIGVPVLLVSMILARRGSVRGLLAWLGAVAYFVYCYVYAFAIAFNPLFLVYVALLSLTAFALVRTLAALDARDIAARFDPKAPVGGVGAFLWTIGGGLGLMELAQVVPAMVAGKVPDFVVRTGHPTGVVYIADLGFIVPLMFLAGLWIRRRRPWGFVAATIMLMKGVAEGLALLSSNVFGYFANQKTDGPLIVLWATIAFGSLAFAIRLFRSIYPGDLSIVPVTEGGIR